MAKYKGSLVGVNFLDIIEDMKFTKEGEPMVAVLEGAKGTNISHYIKLSEFTNDQLNNIIDSYNEFLKQDEINAPKIYKSYLRDKDDRVENLSYAITKMTQGDRGAKKTFVQLTGRSPEEFDKMSAKERLAASNLFELADQYHLLDRGSGYYSTETIKNIYDIATDKKFSRLSLDDFRNELINRLYSQDIIDKTLYNTMKTGAPYVYQQSAQDKKLLGV